MALPYDPLQTNLAIRSPTISPLTGGTVTKTVVFSDRFLSFSPMAPTQVGIPTSAWRYFSIPLSPPNLPWIADNGSPSVAPLEEGQPEGRINYPDAAAFTKWPVDLLGTPEGVIDRWKFFALVEKPFYPGALIQRVPTVTANLNTHPMTTPVNCGAELGFEAKVAVAQTGFDPNLALQSWVSGVTAAHSDPRLGGGVLVFYDPVSQLVAGFWLTDQFVYGVYERWPFELTGWLTNPPVPGMQTEYHSFSSMRLLASRQQFLSGFMQPASPLPIDDFVTLSLLYNPALNRLSWVIEGTVVWQVERVGLPTEFQYQTLDHGGADRTFTPTGETVFRLGMGLMDALDMNNPAFGDWLKSGAPVGASTPTTNAPEDRGLVRLGVANQYVNPRWREPPIGTQYVAGDFHVTAPLEGDVIFGQGVQMRVRDLQVFTLT